MVSLIVKNVIVQLRIVPMNREEYLATFEEITKEKYEEMITKVVPIINGNISVEQSLDYSSECVGGVCPIR